MSEKNATEKGSTFKLREHVNYQDGAIVSRIIYKLDKHNLTIFAFDKGQSLSEHTVPFDAIVHIVDGIATIVIDGKSHEVKEGESIIMPANIPHEVKADQRFKMLLTMIRV